MSPPHVSFPKSFLPNLISNVLLSGRARAPAHACLSAASQADHVCTAVRLVCRRESLLFFGPAFSGRCCCSSSQKNSFYVEDGRRRRSRLICYSSHLAPLSSPAVKLVGLCSSWFFRPSPYGLAKFAADLIIQLTPPSSSSPPAAAAASVIEVAAGEVGKFKKKEVISATSACRLGKKRSQAWL